MYGYDTARLEGRLGSLVWVRKDQRSGFRHEDNKNFAKDVKFVQIVNHNSISPAVPTEQDSTTRLPPGKTGKSPHDAGCAAQDHL